MNQTTTGTADLVLIGAGLPRTGTLTQKLALEHLGLGPCYHWVNVIADLDQVGLWDRALDGEAPWGEVFGGHRSTVDWPGGYFYRELMDAKKLIPAELARIGGSVTRHKDESSAHHQ